MFEQNPKVAEEEIQNDDGSVGQAEVTRDEFGGYCCKRWGAAKDQKGSQNLGKDSLSGDLTEANTEDNICKLLGLDIDKQALEIVKQDFKKKKIPWKSAGKFISVSNTAGKLG